MAPISAPRSWASLLAFLEADVASAVETMARRLQVLMDSDPRWSPGADEPNGFGGIDRHGHLDRLLLTEWLFAAEEPLEFSRRLAMGELTYLRRELVAPRSPTRIVLLADVGPDQLGAPRLVHLAGLVVLARRAEAQGVPLALGLLSDEPGTFREGELPDLFGVWRRARSATRPSESQVDAWLTSLDERDHGWMFTGVRPLPEGPFRISGLRRLTARESEWGEGGATAIEVVVDRTAVRLPLPQHSESINLLRGESLKRHSRTAISRSHQALRFPRFTGQVRRLICRTTAADEILAMPIPREETTNPRHPRRHHFPGPVLAAAVIGTRTVALVSVAGSIKVHIIGKRLGSVGTIDVDPADLELDAASIQSLVEGSLEPLLFDSGAILVRLRGQWWSLRPLEEPSKIPLVAAGPSEAIDQPRTARLGNDRLWAQPWSFDDYLDGGAVVFGPKGSLAYELGEGSFAVRGPFGGRTIRIGPDDKVRGLTILPDGEPALVVQTAGTRIIRLDGPERSRTLSTASGDVIEVSVHATEPLLAIQRGDGAIEVFDLPDGRALAYVLPD